MDSIKPTRCSLPIVASLLMMTPLAAQSSPLTAPSHTTPAPTQWTATPTSIDATSLPTGSDSAFPDFVPRRTSGVGGASGDPSAKTRQSTLAGPVVTIAASLAVVLGLFAAMIWITRRFGSRGMNQNSLPREVLQSLGKTPIDARTSVTMLRCGNRILVLAQTATGIHPLSEITDAEEVRQLTATCLGDASKSFASTIQRIEKEPAPKGFSGTNDDPGPKRRRSKLFANA